MPFFGQMCAEVGDNSYSKPAYLQANRSKENLVTIVRVRSNRTFYLQPMLPVHLARRVIPHIRLEEHGWLLVHLAFLQLWVARKKALSLSRPWERSSPKIKDQPPSPGMVQRDFGRIIRQIGAPVQIPKRRANSPGRPKGTVLASILFEGILICQKPNYI